MLKKDRLFIFGDSWASNIFRVPKYEDVLAPVNNGLIPYHLSDYLSYHYDVYNYGMGGSSNSQIIYQFSNLPEFREGDRILVIWSHYTRFNLWEENGDIINYGDFNIAFENDPSHPEHAPVNVYNAIRGRLRHLVLAESTPLDKISNTQIREELKFYNWYVRTLEKWQPIVMTWENTLSKLLNINYIGYDAPFYNNENITFITEYDYFDAHLGGRGNYLLYRYTLNLLNTNLRPIEQSYRVFKREKAIKPEKNKTAL